MESKVIELVIDPSILPDEQDRALTSIGMLASGPVQTPWMVMWRTSRTEDS